MNGKEIRQTFLDFFKNKSHKIVSSAPIVNKSDPTLMFTNAGMNQFKDYFLGTEVPGHRRVTDTQKCLRVSGKHNDLEEVGLDGYHHTMFEMLGNWSFGDYFKEETIAWAWELLTEKLGVDPDLLYATVFSGDKADDLGPDVEAEEIWKKYLPGDRILRCDKRDNFWEMGEHGPCGPCSEIHIDLRSPEDKKNKPGAHLINADHPEVIEIWNLVFIQYNRSFSGELSLLPEKHVDTGMGFERLCMVLQNKRSSYDTDLFSPYIGKIESITGVKYTGSYNTEDRSDIAFRVVSDHLRAVVFAIADGQLPSNTGAGYVIRRILRRAVRYYYSFLDTDSPLLVKLVPVMIDEMGHVFPEIKKQKDLLMKVIEEEESSFLKTLENGLKRLEQVLSESKEIDGETAFEMYDTYGFPI
ncbi:MAG: alanine--tRNA ligase, partial [Saprospiraceae bacterium]|nr:alanine--tRNA ligase [Saprospiraceae bacterium]